jgi:hypothetical protein
MFNRIFGNTRILVPLMLVVTGLLLLAAFLLASGAPLVQAHSAAAAQAAGAATSPRSVLAPVGGGEGSTICTVSEVGVLEDRIHIRCTVGTVTGTDTVFFFAYPTDSLHAATANRFLTLMNSAYALTKQITVGFASDPVNNPAGCVSTDCRRLIWLTTLP